MTLFIRVEMPRPDAYFGLSTRLGIRGNTYVCETRLKNIPTVHAPYPLVVGFIHYQRVLPVRPG
jgi:hypothetical protein